MLLFRVRTWIWSLVGLRVKLVCLEIDCVEEDDDVY